MESLLIFRHDILSLVSYDRGKNNILIIRQTPSSGQIQLLKKLHKKSVGICTKLVRIRGPEKTLYNRRADTRYPRRDKYTRRVCREGTKYPRTHYGPVHTTHPWHPLCSVLDCIFKISQVPNYQEQSVDDAFYLCRCSISFTPWEQWAGCKDNKKS